MEVAEVAEDGRGGDLLILSDQECTQWDIPGGSKVTNVPYNARDMGLIPGQGPKITHAAR